MQERMWLNVYLYINTKIIHTPSPVFLELIIRIDHQWKVQPQKIRRRFQGLMYSVYCSSFLIKLILKKYFYVAIVGNEGSLESNIYSTILSTKNWYEYGIRLVGKRTSCSDFGNENMVGTGPSELGSWHGNIPMFSGKNSIRVSGIMQVLGEDSGTLGSIEGFTSRLLLNRKANINSIADVYLLHTVG